MNRAWRGRVVPGITASFCLALTSAATVWSGRPLYSPLKAEFHWPAALMTTAGLASLGITAFSIWWMRDFVDRMGERRAAVTGCLWSGLLLLLGLPNLTHLWQASLLLLALGLTRAAVLSAAWHEFRRGLAPRLALGAAALSALAGLLIATPWIAQVTYRNSWREGAAFSGGILLILATPFAYILMPGTDPGPPTGEPA